MVDISFNEALTKAGLYTKDKIIADGRLHRFQVEGDKARSKTGWYILFNGDVCAGSFGCWKRGFSQNWCDKSNRELTKEERQAINQQIEQAKKRRDEEQAAIHRQAAKKASDIWRGLKIADSHPYLTNKGVQSYGLRLQGDQLVIPVMDDTGSITSLQFIDDAGGKRFLKGGKKKGCSKVIGGHTESIAHDVITPLSYQFDKVGKIAVTMILGRDDFNEADRNRLTDVYVDAMRNGGQSRLSHALHKIARGVRTTNDNDPPNQEVRAYNLAA